MKQKDFVFNLFLLIFLNLLIKPFWVLGIDVGVQNSVGAENYGLYFSIFNFSMLFYMFLDMGTTNFNNKTIARNTQLLDKHLSGYIVLRLLLGVVYFAIIFSAALLIGYRGRQLHLLFWIGLNQFLGAFLLYVRSNISALLMFKTDSIMSVLDRLLMILFCGILLWGNVTQKSFQIEWFVWCQTAAYVISIIIALSIVLSKTKLIRLRWNRSFILMIIKKSLPYALITFLMACYYRIDSVLLERILPRDIAATETGIYASAFRLLDVLVMISYLFSVILLPLFSKMLKQKEDITPVVRTSFSLLFLFSVSAVTILYIFREPVISFIYHEHIEQSTAVFRLVIFGLIPISMNYLFGTLLTANGSMKILNYTALIGLAINVIVNILLIPKFHAEGSAAASFCTQAVVSLLQFYFALKITEAPLSTVPIFRAMIFLAIIIPTTLLLHRILNFHLIVNLAICASAALCAGVITGLLNIRELKTNLLQ